MSCGRYDALLAEAVADELGAEERQALDAHLAACAACRETLEECRASLAALRALPAPMAGRVERTGSVFALEAAGAAGERAAPRRSPGSWLRYAASVLIAFTAGYAFHAGVVLSGRGVQVPVAATPVVVDATPRGAEETLRGALTDVYAQHPQRTDLAKGLMAVFSTGRGPVR